MNMLSLYDQNDTKSTTECKFYDENSKTMNEQLCSSAGVER